MSQNLTNQYIVDTYDGILHSETTLPTTGTTPMYDGMGNQSDISIGKLGQGVKVHTMLSAADLKVGNLNFPTSATTGQFLIATSSGEVEFQDFPENGVVAKSWNLGEIKHIVVDTTGRITNMATFGDDLLKKDMARTRIQDAPTTQTTDVYLTNVWQKLEFTIDVDTGTQNKVVKGGNFFIERSASNGAALSANANLRSSLNAVWDTGSAITYDPNGHRILLADQGVNRVGVQFFSGLSAHPVDEDKVVIYLRDENNSGSYWNISLEATHY